MCDTFHWDFYDSPIEDIERYRPGGYHPVKLGDCFSTLPSAAPSTSNLSSPRYCILHKLGYGSFATVWLARDLLPPGRFVALKITVADHSVDNREARIFKLLADHSTVDIEGSQHVLTMLDNFQIKGPNGIHEVLVTEVLAPLSDLKRRPVYEKFRKPFIHQALRGVSYLHSQGIAHGDLHLDNFGCSIPGLNERTESDLLEHFGIPECVPILAVNLADQTASLPPHLIGPISMADYLANAKPPLPIEAELPLLKILDFGNAFQQGEARQAPGQPAFKVRSPEIVFPMIALGDNDPNWDVRSDIWSLACTIYEIIGGSTFFYGVGTHGLLRRMVQLVGQVPPLWALYWASNEYLKDEGALLNLLACLTLNFAPEISAARASAEWMNRRPILVGKCKSEQEADRVIDLLRSMLVLDPAERPSIRQVLETHRWLEPNNDV